MQRFQLTKAPTIWINVPGLRVWWTLVIAPLQSQTLVFRVRHYGNVFKFETIYIYIHACIFLEINYLLTYLPYTSIYINSPALMFSHIS